MLSLSRNKENCKVAMENYVFYKKMHFYLFYHIMFAGRVVLGGDRGEYKLQLTN